MRGVLELDLVSGADVGRPAPPVSLGVGCPRTRRFRRAHWPSTRIPTTRRSRRAARWRRGPRPAPRSRSSSRPRVTRGRGSGRRSGRARPPAGGGDREGRRRCSGFSGHFHLGYHDGELPDDQGAAGRDHPLRARAPTRGRALPGPDRGVLRRRLLQPPRPPRHGLGDARRGRAGRRATRTTSRSTSPRGSTCTTCSAVYLSGTFEPNVWVDISDTLERKIDAIFCHASQLTETGERFREFLRGTGPSRPAAQAGVSLRRGVPPADLRAAELRVAAAAGAAIPPCARKTRTATIPTPTAARRAPTDERAASVVAARSRPTQPTSTSP